MTAPHGLQIGGPRDPDLVGLLCLLLIIAAWVAMSADAGATTAGDCPTRTGRSATVLIHPDARGPLAAGDVVRAEGPSGCVGEVTVGTTGVALTLWQDDEFVPGLAGLETGDPFTLRLVGGPRLRPTFGPTPMGPDGPVYQTDALYLVASLDTAATSVGFAPGPHVVTAATARVGVDLVVSGPAVGGLQFDVTGAGGAVPSTVEPADTLAALGFTVATSLEGGALRVLAYGGRLPAGTYPSLFTVAAEVTSPGALTISGAVGALDNAAGTDAGLTVGRDAVTFTTAAPYGDGDGDGALTVFDLVAAVDAVLGRTAPAVLDVHPFPTDGSPPGNGAVDVRDVTVLAKAIASGAWPDGTPTAVTAGSARLAAATGDVHVAVDGPSATVEARVPIRALLVDFETASLTAATAPPGVVLVAEAVAGQPGRFRALAYRLDRDPLPASFALAHGATPVTFVSGTAVGSDGASVSVGAAGPVDADPGPPPGALAVYPNPTSGGATVTLSTDAPGTAALEVLDVRGRRVAVLHDGPLGPGRHAFQTPTLAPGLYVVRTTTRAGTTAHPLTVVR